VLLSETRAGRGDHELERRERGKELGRRHQTREEAPSEESNRAMDSEHWISRLAAAKRYYAAQLGHIDDMPGMGVEEVEMEMEDDGDVEMEMALELGDATWPEVACPYCYEDHDVASLCVHLEEDHPYEPHAAPCPICSQRITRDMLNHITMQHGYLFKVHPSSSHPLIGIKFLLRLGSF